jgi:tight adherence protein B
MPYLLTALTFIVIVGVLVVLFYLGIESHQQKVVQRRLEAIDRGMRRGTDATHLKLVREELLSSVPTLNRMLVHWSWAERLRDFVRQAGLNEKPGRLILLGGVLALGGYLVGKDIYQNRLIAASAAAGGSAGPFVFVAIKRMRRLHAFEKAFTDAIDLLGRAVRAGHSFSTGMEMISSELAEPVAGEFRAVFDEQNFGLPLKDALLNLAERVPLIDVRFFVTALLIQKDTGGNLAEILGNLSHVVRERFKVLGEVRTRTAQGRLTAAILIALPPAMMLILRFMNPEYEGLLFTDPLGPYMLGLAAGLQVIGAGLLWKIVHIQV